MTLVRAPGPPLPRFDHRVAAEPRPPGRPTGASGGRRRSTAGDTSHPGGRSPSRAPQWTPSAACSRGWSPSWPFPQERRRGDQVVTCRCRLAWRRTLVQRGASLKPSPPPARAYRPQLKPDVAVRRREKRSRPDPKGVVAIGLGPLPKERRIYSAAVRIPGPDSSGRSGADTQRIDLGGSRALRHPSVTLRRRRDESRRLATALVSR
jgi:hypothetical protein